MTAVAEIKNPIELRKAGVKALIDVLGYENAHAFLNENYGTPGRDYTKWRSEQPERPIDDVVADVLKLQDEIEQGVIDNAGRPMKK
ncbi:MAG: hypothetical protein LBC59_02720 [Chitinispirillales bacterium]|jgi:hypothetical protein|nr:hypothetical protein [Chitinispirillales bacterium]